VSWITRLRRKRPRLAPDQARRLAACEALRANASSLSIEVQRYVVVDVETSGLRPYSDTLLAIGAVAVSRGLIPLGEVFAAVLRQSEPSPVENILVHGIDGTTQTGAMEPAEALLRFLEFTNRSPLIAFHADFDRTFVERAAESFLGVRTGALWLDLAAVAPAFFPEHARDVTTLDGWTRLFGIENHSRHDAVSDALATAQLLQVVLAKAAQQGVSRFSDLASHAKAHRWLARR
jgi:DNA polymerase III subunit epsilon